MKGILRRASLALAWPLALAPLAPQQIGIYLGTAPTAHVPPGSTLAVPITVDLSAAGSANIASLQAGLHWGASRLAFDSLRVAVPGWTLVQNTAGASAGSISFAASSSVALPNSTALLNAYFTAGATGGTRLSLTPTAAGNQSAASILPLLRPARLDVCVAPLGKWGDVTGDSTVNIVDAQQIARFSVGLGVADPLRVANNGDVTGDGIVNIVDAQQIARHAVALPAAQRIATDAFTPPAVSSILLSPGMPQQIAVGGLLQLTPTPLDDTNADLAGCAGIIWTSSNPDVATVSATGLVVGVAPGSATITARSVTTPATAATLAVTVPGPGSAPIVFFTEGFDDANFRSRGWYDNTSPIVSTTEKQSGAGSVEYRFAAGGRSPIAGGAMRRKFAPSNSVYISYWVKYSDNWVGSSRPYHPHEFHVLSTADGDFTGPGHAQLTLYVEHSYQNGGRPRLGMQDNKVINISFGNPPINLTSVTENRSVSGCNGILEANILSECFALAGETPPWFNLKQLLGPVVMQPNPGPGYKGNWNYVEAYFQMNTVVNGVGQTDGIMQYWFNGTQILSRNDIIFRTGARPNLQFSQFLIVPHIGTPGSPIDQTFWVDNLTVASARVQ